MSSAAAPPRRRLGLTVNPQPGASLAVKLVLAVEILAAYVAARARMRDGDVRRLVAASRRARAGAVPRAPAGAPERWRLSVTLGYAVTQVLQRLPTDSRCLVQSLVLSRLLSVRGIPSTFVIGARSRPEFEAHAWVEVDGRAVLPLQGFDESRLLEL